jgi:hypothetical protein
MFSAIFHLERLSSHPRKESGMEKVLKRFDASNWPIVQVLFLSINVLGMLLVFQQSGWGLNVGMSLVLPLMFTWFSYREVRRLSREATTDKGRLDANWQFLQFTITVVAVLGLCISILRSHHCH